MRSSQYAGAVIRTKPRRPTVAVVVFDGMSPFETGIVIEVFGLPRPELDVEWYDLLVCSVRPGPIRTVGGLSLEAPCGVESLAAADTVIVPGVSDVHQEVDAELVAALRSAYDRGARIVSICSGAFALAAAGILDGRRAATHWQYASLLADEYPLVRVESDVLYVDEGQVLTSAGSAAGLDLCLHLVRLDHGAAVANSVARRLVIPPHRDGGQAQFVELPVPADLDDARIAHSMAWAIEHLGQPVTLDELAAVAHMSARSYSRHFAQKTGLSPIRWLIGQRVMASLALLERGDATIDEVAGRVGFESAITYRQHFRRAMATTPTAYRRAFTEKQGSDADRVPDGLRLQERRQPVSARVGRPVSGRRRRAAAPASGCRPRPARGPAHSVGVAPVRSSPLTSACDASQGATSDTLPVSRLTTPPGTSEVASTSASVTAGSGRSVLAARRRCCRRRWPARSR